MKPGPIASFVAAACCAAAVQAADIYRWVDDAGKTHLSDTVPERYRARATRIDASAYELTPADRARAEERARKARSTPVPPRTPAPAPATSLGGAPGAAAAAASRPAANDASDCPGWQQRYAASQECFARFKLVNGGTRPEAFQQCTEVPDPATQCGMPRTP